MLFNAFDERKTGEIDFRELMMGLNLATSDIPDLKLAFHFKTFDCDNSGYLNSQDVHIAVDLIFKVCIPRFDPSNELKQQFVASFSHFCIYPPFHLQNTQFPFKHFEFSIYKSISTIF